MPNRQISKQHQMKHSFGFALIVVKIQSIEIKNSFVVDVILISNRKILSKEENNFVKISFVIN